MLVVENLAAKRLLGCVLLKLLIATEGTRARLKNKLAIIKTINNGEFTRTSRAQDELQVVYVLVPLVLQLSPKMLKELDKYMAKAVQKKLRLSTTTSKKEIYLKNEDFGLGLYALEDMQKYIYPAAYINYGINSI